MGCKMDSEILKSSGIDFDKGVARFLGDRQLYESILITFLYDDTFEKGKAALETENYKNLYEFVHTLKGVAGNTDMTTLYLTTAVLSEYLRKCEVPEKDRVFHLFCGMEEAYYAVMKGIAAAKEA
ncbi:hypothetical protein SAMN02745151_01622 [[Clostridium] propionicum DSM 1682]|uniref:Hpt domain protein n=2 Tax=Anaerotignum propionicum TaxID=28446 RepID=A0A0X1U794_ANAPI|nr:hypothetical protein CPRO_12110 [Anaerotignum propionicum DSM 1682]SHE73840.1 hypothetical protein SAMN02745151_01622 [[Clostridium] propionicum DSM 1682] [Anaerotignum propionicum DSM 1682]